MDEKELKETLDNIKQLGSEMTGYRKRVEKLEADHRGTAEADEAMRSIAKDVTKEFVTHQELENAKKYADEINQKVDTLKHLQTETGVKDTKHRDAVMEFLRRGGKLELMRPEHREFLASPEYHKYASFLKQTDLETRTITEGNPASAGLFVDPQTESEILKNYTNIDNVRAVARVITLSGTNELKGYKRTGIPTGYHDTETGSGTASQSIYTPFKIGVHPIIVKTPVSGDMLEDVSFIYSEVVSDAGECFSYTEGYDFVLGNGIDRPLGFRQVLADTDTTKFFAQVTSTSANVIAGDDFAKMFTSLKVPYRTNCAWAFNSTSLYQILILKTAVTGEYLWVPGIQGGIPNMIYGRPFIICESLPSAAADVLPVYLVDWQKAYYIVDRSGIQLLRDDYTSWPVVNFNMRKRVGGQVVKSEAGVALLTT